MKDQGASAGGDSPDLQGIVDHEKVGVGAGGEVALP